MSGVQDRSAIANLFKWDFSYSWAAVDKISTDTARLATMADLLVTVVVVVVGFCTHALAAVLRTSVRSYQLSATIPSVNGSVHLKALATKYTAYEH